MDKVERDTIEHAAQCAIIELNERIPGGLDEDGFIEGGFDDATAWHLWTLVLLLALRYRATSVHYHPWRGEDALACVVDDTRYPMVPPPEDLSKYMVSVWRSRLSPGWFRKAAQWLTGRQPLPVSGLVRLRTGAASTDWLVVCGQANGSECVDLTRVMSVPPGEPIQEIRV